MSNSQHTPGPWAAHPAEGKYLWEVRAVDGSVPVARMGLVDNGPSAVVANARLVAAAPEMLEALKEMLATVEDAVIDGRGCLCSRCGDARKKASSVIAKLED